MSEWGGVHLPLEKVFLPDKPSVPKLHLDTAVEFPGLSPFYTREECFILSKKKEEKDAKGYKKDNRSGWCECCNSNYKNFEQVGVLTDRVTEQHIASHKHQSFASEKKNYAQIDAFIGMLEQKKL